MDGLNSLTELNRRLHTSEGVMGWRTMETVAVVEKRTGEGHRFQWDGLRRLDGDEQLQTQSRCPLLPPPLSSSPIIHRCVHARGPGGAHLHPFAPAAHRVAEHEEEDERHRRRDGQRHQEVREVVPGLHGLGRRVVLPKLGQDAGARFRAGDVHRDHFVDVNLKVERILFVEMAKLYL